MEEQFDELLGAYIDKFGEGFPTYQICRGRTIEESVEIIRECIAKEKDAYELGYCTLDEDVYY